MVNRVNVSVVMIWGLMACSGGDAEQSGSEVEAGTAADAGSNDTSASDGAATAGTEADATQPDAWAMMDGAASPADTAPSPSDALPDATTGPDDATTVLDATPPLYLALTVHLEGWNVQVPGVFANYADKIRAYAELANSHGAHLSWEARNIVEPSQLFGDNILAELIATNGDTVGLHADIGGPLPGGQAWTEVSYQAALEAMRGEMGALGITPTTLSGQCSPVDWVTTAVAAGFTAVSGIVDYCLKSLPLDAQTPAVQACQSPADCHGTYPKDPGAKMHPWLAKDGATWTTHEPTGELLIVPSSGSIVCAAENASDDASHTGCVFDESDIDTVIGLLDQAISLVDPNQLNTQLFVWSFGEALDTALFESFFQQVATRVNDGEVVWTSMAGIEALYYGGELAPPVTSPPTPTVTSEQVYVVIHCEPHGDEVCGTPGESQWDTLVEIVTTADAHGHLLTLLMSADWAECVSAAPERLLLLKSWLLAGHQLGYHHHDCSHPTPDGYRADAVTNCDIPPCSTCQGTLKGTVEASFAILEALEAQLVEAGVPAALASIEVANMGPNKWCASKGQCFRQHEWSASLPWSTETVGDNPVSPGAPYSFLTAPHCRQYSDGEAVFDVLETGHAQLNVGGFTLIKPDNNYGTIEDELAVMASGELGDAIANMGIVFHPQEFDATSLRPGDPVAPNDRAYIEAIFDLLADQGKLSVTVRDILDTQASTCP
jgi:hypothetical protein